MTTSGYMLRRDQALAARGEEPCPNCGHPRRLHRELQGKWELVDGELEYQEHPEYEPLVFACGESGCDCRLDERERTGG